MTDENVQVLDRMITEEEYSKLLIEWVIDTDKLKEENEKFREFIEAIADEKVHDGEVLDEYCLEAIRLLK